jgi:PKD repeat protein
LRQPAARKDALVVGESMTATYNGTAVAGQHTNTGTTYGGYGTSGTLTVQDADAVNYLGIALFAVPPSTALPTDADGINGLYEDVNGNGRKDFNDVVLYFYQMSWIAANNEQVVAFDYNLNMRIDFADVVWLFTSL